MRLLLPAALALGMYAQESMLPRVSPAAYAAYAAVDSAQVLAAEFQGRTVPAPDAAFILKDYVVVELALFTGPFEFNSGSYSLRLNGKSALLAQSPGMVAASLKYADWEGGPQMTAVAGVGDANVILGRRNTTPRFPGDRRLGQPPPGTPVKETADPENAAWNWVSKVAWQDGPGKGPAGGLLYFPYKGNLAKLKTIDLIYNGRAGLVTLRLRGSAASRAKSEAQEGKP